MGNKQSVGAARDEVMFVTVEVAMGNSLLVPARDEVMSVTVELAMVTVCWFLPGMRLCL